MKRVLALILSLSITLTMIINIPINVNAAQGDGIVDFDVENPTLSDDVVYIEDGYSIRGRVSHTAHNHTIATGGKYGNYFYSTATKTTSAALTTDATLLINIIPDTVKKVTAGQYYEVSVDYKHTGTGNFQLLGMEDNVPNGRPIQIFQSGSSTVDKTMAVKAFSGASVTSKENTWYNLKLVIKSNDTDASKTGEFHHYWLYIDNVLVDHNAAAMVSDKSEVVPAFDGFNSFQFRSLGTTDSTTKDYLNDLSIGFDNFKVTTYDEFPYPQTSSLKATDTFDFSNYVSNTQSGATTAWGVTSIRTGHGTATDGSDLYKYNNVKGKFGKAADDSTFEITHAAGTYAGSDSSVFTTIDRSDRFVTSSKTDYYEVSMDMAHSGSYAKQLRTAVKTYDGDINPAFLVEISGNGTVSFPFFSLSSVFTMESEEWYNFRFVIEPNNDGVTVGSNGKLANKVWIYINGHKIVDGVLFESRVRSNAEYKNGFNGILNYSFLLNTGLGSKAEWTDAAAAPKWYVDNLKAATYLAFPENKFSLGVKFDNMDDAADVSSTVAQLEATPEYFSKANTTITGSSANIQGGLLGKSADDKAVSINTTESTTRNNIERLNISTALKSAPTLEIGDWVDYEVYLAGSGDIATGVQGFHACNPGKEDGKDHTGSVFYAYATGKVSIYGQATNVLPDYYIMRDNWYKVNLVMRSGSASAADDADKNWIKVYINDELVHSASFNPIARTDVSKTEEIDTFEGFYAFWLQSQITSDDTRDLNSASYFDDFKITYHGKTEPTFSAPVTVTTTDKYAKLYLGSEGTRKVGYNDASSYIDERVSLASDAWSVTDKTIEFADDQVADGNNYMRIIKADGTKLYDTLVNSTEVLTQKLFAQDSVFGTEFHNINPKQFSSFNFVNAHNARSDGDYSFYMPTSDFWQTDASKDNQNPFIQLNPGTHFSNNIKSNKPWSLGFSVLVDGEFISFDFQAQDSTSIRNLFTLNNSNGCIFVNRNVIYLDEEKTIAASFNKNEWINIVINFYPVSQKAEVFMDGQLIYTGDLTFDPLTFSRMKFQMTHPSNTITEENKISSAMSLDDIYFRQGSAFIPSTITAGETSNNLDGASMPNGYITANASATVEDVISGVTGGTVSMFDTNAYENALTTGDITSGNIAVIKSADGLVYDYYYIADTSEEAKISFATAPKYAAGANTFAPVLNTSTIVNGNLLAASYQTYGDSKETDMIDCNFASFDGASYKYDGVSLKVTPSGVALNVHADATVVKLYVWDNLTSINPLGEAIKLSK